MDLSLRSYVGGWKAIFLEDTTCLNELPASFFAYRKQQHRWTCGPVQLWRKTAYYIWHSNLPFHRKVCLDRLIPADMTQAWHRTYGCEGCCASSA